MAKEPMHTKMYKESPKMKRDDASGEMKVRKEKDTEKEQTERAEGTNVPADGFGMPDRHAGERMEMRHRHIKEHVDLHTKHAMEHMHAKGEKHALHEKHEREHKEMHERHHSEMKKMHERHEKEHGTEGSGAGEAKIEKVEKSKE